MFAPGGGQDRLYRVSSFQLQGPFGAQGISPTPSRERIFSSPSDPKAGELQRGNPTDPNGEAACARQIITSLATRAYRRPVSAEDVNELLQYYQDGVKEDGGFEGGIRSAITGLLASPFFLTRRTRPRRLAPRRHLPDHRPRACVEALVLPLEHDPRCRAAAARHRGEN